MPTQVVVEMRKRFEGCDASLETQVALKHLIDLVEEYGNALLDVTCGGSEFFRKNGSEVDPKACVEYVRKIRNDLQRSLMKALKS